MYSEDDLIPLSALQHLLFCERRAALVHIEKIWDENSSTAAGRIAHSKVDVGGPESRGDLRIARGLLLRSLHLGLTGKADVVEFHRLRGPPFPEDSPAGKEPGTRLDGKDGLWRPFPVEYKSGKRRNEEGYLVQVCAQALCLEEMLGVEVPSGAIYFGKTARRLEVAFDQDLRRKTESAARRLHEIFRSGETPAARFENKCKKCSLLDLCVPRVLGRKGSVEAYLATAIPKNGGSE